MHTRIVTPTGMRVHRTAMHWPDDTARTACGETITDALYMAKTASTLTKTANCKLCFPEEKENP